MQHCCDRADRSVIQLKSRTVSNPAECLYSVWKVVFKGLAYDSPTYGSCIAQFTRA